jgi:peptidoglycan/LPS O-acetylase OafA/YrhL
MLAYKSLRGSSSSDHLDLMRGAAAIAVMLWHLRSLFLVEFSEIASANPIVKLVYLACGFSREAVMIFFVLSGFLVGGSVIRGRMDGEWSWGVYFTNRLSRLWVVLIPALILGAIWDHSGTAIFGSAGTYGAMDHATWDYSGTVATRLSASVMIGNALFLQGILTPMFGSNGPLWSLSYEFWYYVLFPLIVLAVPTKKVELSTGLYSAAAVMVMFFIGRTISLYFLIWLMGAALNLAPELSDRPAKLWIVAGVGALLVVLALIAFKLGDAMYSRDLVIGVASSAVIFVVLRMDARSKSGLYSRTVRRMAGFSYTLYLVHVPALMFISAWLVGRGRWQPDAAHIAIVAALGICALAYASAIGQLTEARTGAVRSRVIAALGLRG